MISNEFLGFRLKNDSRISGSRRKTFIEVGIRGQLMLILTSVILISGSIVAATSYYNARNLAYEKIKDHIETRAEDWKRIVDSYVEEMEHIRELEDGMIKERLSVMSTTILSWMESEDNQNGGPGSTIDWQREILYNKTAEIELGETGYVWIIGGEGDDRGHYIVSDDRNRDGEDLWNVTDTDGYHFVQDIVENGMKTPLDPYIIEYPWRNPGEVEPSQKVAAVTYYQPWDAIIGASAYFKDYRTDVEFQMKERLLEKMSNQTIGKTGYLWVLEGTGPDRGSYILSNERKRDGENLWNLTQDDGTYFVQEIIVNGKISPSEAFFYSYQWRNPGEQSERKKISAITYVEEWDWVIGASAYESEFLEDVVTMRDRILLFTGLEILLALLISFGVGNYYSKTITKPLKKLAEKAERIKTGNSIEEIGNSFDSSSREIRYLASSLDNVRIAQSERDQALRKVTESEAKFRDLAEMLPESVFEADKNGTITFLNHNGLIKFGYRKDELIGRRNLIELIIPQQRRIARNRLEELLNGREPNPKEYCGLMKNGKTFPMIAHTTMNRSVGTSKGYRGVIIDITDRKRAERRIKEERNKAEFYLDMLGHDIGNLHMGLSTSLELALMLKKDRKSQEKALEIANEVAKKSMKLTESVMLISKIRSESPMLQRIDIKPLLIDAIDQVRKTYPSREMMIHLHGNSRRINAEPILKEAFYNLIQNGIKVQKTDEPWIEITIKDSKWNDWISIEICDKGYGIPDSEKERIFERFWTSGKESRIGLGLSIVKALVDRYNGRLSVTDRVNGDYTKGTKFILEFPKG
jgi:PAS domain S-box-containing protein